jgi:hypothetical protein
MDCKAAGKGPGGQRVMPAGSSLTPVEKKMQAFPQLVK